MRPSVLILSPSGDPNAACMAHGLRELGVDPYWMPSLDSLGPVSLEEDGSGGWAAQMADLGSDLRSVWYRRPRAPRPTRGVAPCDIEFVSDEWNLFQRNVFAMGPELTEALWVNPARAAVECENKLVQLRAARQAGLRVPATLLSNDLAAVRRFIKAHGRVIFKTFSAHTWRDAESGELNNTVATVLEVCDPLEEAAVALCPGIYQAYVDKVADFRVTIIGNRCFPVRITRATGGAFVDWRPRTHMDDLIMEPWTLPADVEHRLMDLMARLGLVFGCVDLVLDAQGQIHFLEVNQSGQFMFLEERVPELPLCRAMCAMLAEGRVDYALDGATELSLARFLASESYQAWAESNPTRKGVESWLVSQE